MIRSFSISGCQCSTFASVARLRVGSQVFSKHNAVGVDRKTRTLSGSTTDGRNNSKPVWHSYPKKKGTRFGTDNQGVEGRPDGCFVSISSRRKPDGRAGILSCFTRVEAWLARIPIRDRDRADTDWNWNCRSSESAVYTEFERMLDRKIRPSREDAISRQIIEWAA
jgi:hypothetical protein